MTLTINTTTLALADTLGGTMTSNLNTISAAVMIHLQPLGDSSRHSGSLVASNGSLAFQRFEGQIGNDIGSDRC